MGKLNFDLEEFQEASIKFRKDLLMIPLFAVRDTSQYMTTLTGIRGTELVGKKAVKGAQFAPYKANRKSDIDLDIKLRPITTYFGSLNGEFDPNEAISTLLGHAASLAMEGKLASTPTARDVLAMIAKEAGESLHDVLWNAKRNPSGNTTADLFNGFDTITEAEIEDGGFDEKLGNYLDIDDEITQDNILEIFEYILAVMSPKLRARQAYVYTTQAVLDMYNRAYKKSSGAVIYNKKFEQTAVEGSDGKLIILPLASKQGSSFMHISHKVNMVIGVDQESDQERVSVKDYAPDTLTFMMRIFFGEQFRSLDPSQILTVKHTPVALPEPTWGKTEEPPKEGGDSQQGGEGDLTGQQENV